jgi:hypothetical protein
MIKLDDGFLRRAGLGELPVDEKNLMLRHVYETLELRVGTALAQSMSDEQMAEFEGYVGRGDESGALQWLESHFPRYQELVQELTERLEIQLREVAPEVLRVIGMDRNLETR